MKWMRFRVRTNTASEDIIVSAMEDIGLYGAQIEDKVPLSGRELEELFVDEAPVPEISDDTGAEDLACLNFYVEIAETETSDDTDPGQSGATDDSLRLKTDDEGSTLSPEEVKAQMEEVLADLRQYSDIGDGLVTVSVTEDIDWRDNWKQYFHKFFIDDILVLPSWEEMSEEEQKKAGCVLRIDPGAAFGTGLHETTRLAVRALKRETGKNTSVLDVGTGSGVLSILALMFGAGSAVGIDLDPLAVMAAAENRDRNGFTDHEMRILRGDLIGDAAFRKEIGIDGGYDIIVANILPNVLIPLTPVIPELLREEGTLIYSGILVSKAQEVTRALESAGYTVTQREELGEWCSLTAKRED